MEQLGIGSFPHSSAINRNHSHLVDFYTIRFGHQVAVTHSMPPTKRKRLGDVLQERRKISKLELDGAIEEQQSKLIQLGEVLFERGQVGKTDLIQALEEVIRVPYVDCLEEKPDPAAIQLISRELAERCCALPLRKVGTQLMVVLAQPQDLTLLDQMRFSAGIDILPRMGFRVEIVAAIARAYSISDAEVAEAALLEAKATDLSANKDDQKMEFVSTSSRASNRDAFQEIQAELMNLRTPAVRLVSEIITSALEKGASDIHIEPQAKDMAIRLRVDGVLRDLRRIPRLLQNSLVSRIKILSDMDIADRRSPQDGRFLVKSQGREVEMRVSTLPTQYGEKVVMRLLESKAAIKSFGDLGLEADLEQKLLNLLSLPQGTLLVTGPTGSGKSTTLYAALSSLRNSSVNIVTVEDPVEYVLAGISQVHVNTKAGLTFASSLRSILRQDPNIIMVGEIRDHETAEICMKAAQTGHLVLSTLHTNDSISAILRLVDLDIAPFLIAASVTGILAQRLIRKLCVCHSQGPASQEYIDQFMSAGGKVAPAWRRSPVGCTECDQTGFKSRLGIYELLVFDEAVRGLVRESATASQIRDLLRSQGMRLMQEDALEKVALGVTTLEEVLRVVPFEHIASFECHHCGHKLTPNYVFCPFCGGRLNPKANEAAPHDPLPVGAVSER